MASSGSNTDYYNMEQRNSNRILIQRPPVGKTIPRTSSPTPGTFCTWLWERMKGGENQESNTQWQSPRMGINNNNTQQEGALKCLTRPDDEGG